MRRLAYEARHQRNTSRAREPHFGLRGNALLGMGQRERLGRWLFNFPHDWDVMATLYVMATGQVILPLSLTGTALCDTTPLRW